MLRELTSIFKGTDPLAELGDRFAHMLKITLDMNFAAGEILFGEERQKSQRDQLYEWDGEVNTLEQEIRRRVITHLAVPGNSADLPYSLLMISLVKDVERLGDYAKNLSEIVDIRTESLPRGEVLTELMTIRERVESVFRACLEAFSADKREQVGELIQQSRETARRCDQLVMDIGHSDYDAATTTAFILATRYYKRIGAHVLNVLSSLVMPLDKVDFYDEDETRRLADLGDNP